MAESKKKAPNDSGQMKWRLNDLIVCMSLSGRPRELLAVMNPNSPYTDTALLPKVATFGTRCIPISYAQVNACVQEKSRPRRAASLVVKIVEIFIIVFLFARVILIFCPSHDCLPSFLPFL